MKPAGGMMLVGSHPSLVAQWTDEATGLWCAIRKSDLGFLCGYVAVPKAHPWNGLAYDQEPSEVEVHGGLSFSARGAGELWIFGFDCGHFGDAMPGLEGLTGVNTGGVYRDEEYVRRECRSLARQLADAGRTAGKLGLRGGLVRALLLLVVMAGANACGEAAPTTSPATPAPTDRKIAVIGDSTVRDWHRLLVDVGDVVAWSDAGGPMARLFGIYKYSVRARGEAFPGRRLRPVHFTDVVIVGGVNDLKGNGTPDTVAAGLKLIVEDAIHEGKRVYVVGVLPSQLAHATVESCAVQLADIAATNEALAAVPGLSGFVDVWDDFHDGAGFRSELYVPETESIDLECDGVREDSVTRFVHPNDAGGELIAAAVLEVLQ